MGKFDIKLTFWEEIYYFFVRNYNKIKYKVQDVKYFFQRGKKGYSDLDIWDFSDYLCDVLKNGLRELKEISNGCPHGVYDASKKDDECWKWDEILTEMIEGFEAGSKILGGDAYGMHADEIKKLEEKFYNGMDLFKKYFFHLWD